MGLAAGLATAFFAMGLATAFFGAALAGFDAFLGAAFFTAFFEADPPEGRAACFAGLAAFYLIAISLGFFCN
jgi:hypothetical protein